MARRAYQDERIKLPEEYVPGKIGVVTVLYNSASVLADFFVSIERQSYGNFVVYCVDNASTDDSVRQCRRRSDRCVVIENGKNLGVAAGNNMGIRTAIADGCEYVLFLNNDVVFGQDLFECLVRGLDEHACEMTIPLIYYHDRPSVFWAAGGYFEKMAGNRTRHWGEGSEDRKQFSTDRQVEYASTCCVLVKRDVFQRVGLMDERYFVYYDDSDFMLRAKKNGIKIFCLENGSLWHKVSSLTGGDSPFTLYHGRRSQALFVYKHSHPMLALLLSGIYQMWYAFLWLTKRVQRESASIRIRAWREGVRASYTEGARTSRKGTV